MVYVCGERGGRTQPEATLWSVYGYFCSHIHTTSSTLFPSRRNGFSVISADNLQISSKRASIELQKLAVGVSAALHKITAPRRSHPSLHIRPKQERISLKDSGPSFSKNALETSNGADPRTKEKGMARAVDEEFHSDGSGSMVLGDMDLQAGEVNPNDNGEDIGVRSLFRRDFGLRSCLESITEGLGASFSPGVCYSTFMADGKINAAKYDKELRKGNHPSRSQSRAHQPARPRRCDGHRGRQFREPKVGTPGVSRRIPASHRPTLPSFTLPGLDGWHSRGVTSIDKLPGVTYQVLVPN